MTDQTLYDLGVQILNQGVAFLHRYLQGVHRGAVVLGNGVFHLQLTVGNAAQIVLQRAAKATVDVAYQFPGVLVKIGVCRRLRVVCKVAEQHNVGLVDRFVAGGLGLGTDG